MKEATGELNMTVVTVVAIAAVGAFFYAFVWPNIQNSIKLNQACAAAGNNDYTDDTGNVTCKDGTCKVGNSVKVCEKG